MGETIEGCRHVRLRPSWEFVRNALVHCHGCPSVFSFSLLFLPISSLADFFSAGQFSYGAIMRSGFDCLCLRLSKLCCRHHLSKVLSLIVVAISPSRQVETDLRHQYFIQRGNHMFGLFWHTHRDLWQPDHVSISWCLFRTGRGSQAKPLPPTTLPRIRFLTRSIVHINSASRVKLLVRYRLSPTIHQGLSSQPRTTIRFG